MPFRYVGEVIWLTPDQGGRSKGVPGAEWGGEFAQLAHVPPHTIDTGTASFVLRGWDPARWRSLAEGTWLVAPAEGAQAVRVGDAVEVTEGRTLVAFFRVFEVRPVD